MFYNVRAPCLSIVDSDEPGHPGSDKSALRHQLPPVVEGYIYSQEFEVKVVVHQRVQSSSLCCNFVHKYIVWIFKK